MFGLFTGEVVVDGADSRWVKLCEQITQIVELLLPPDGKRDDFYVSTLLAHTLLTLENYTALKELVSGGSDTVTVKQHHVEKAIEWRYEEIITELEQTEPEKTLERFAKFFKGCNDICPQSFLASAHYLCGDTLEGRFQIIKPKLLVAQLPNLKGEFEKTTGILPLMLKLEGVLALLNVDFEIDERAIEG